MIQGTYLTVIRITEYKGLILSLQNINERRFSMESLVILFTWSRTQGQTFGAKLQSKSWRRPACFQCLQKLLSFPLDLCKATLSSGLKARDTRSSTCFCHFDTLSSTTTTLLVWPLTSDTVSLLGSTNHSPSTTYLSSAVSKISNSQILVFAHLYKWVPGPSCKVATHSPSSCCSSASGCQLLKLPATLN